MAARDTSSSRVSYWWKPTRVPRVGDDAVAVAHDHVLHVEELRDAPRGLLQQRMRIGGPPPGEQRVQGREADGDGYCRADLSQRSVRRANRDDRAGQAEEREQGAVQVEELHRVEQALFRRPRSDREQLPRLRLVVAEPAQRLAQVGGR